MYTWKYIDCFTADRDFFRDHASIPLGLFIEQYGIYYKMMREKTIFKNTDGMLVAWSPYFMTELSRGRQYFVEIVSFFLSLCW